MKYRPVKKTECVLRPLQFPTANIRIITGDSLVIISVKQQDVGILSLTTFVSITAEVCEHEFYCRP